MSTYYVAGIPYSDELYHHGIKGQKWGIRRYQNEDGSYTEAGLKRYGAKNDKQANALAKYQEREYRDTKRYYDMKEKAFGNKINKISDKIDKTTSPSRAERLSRKMSKAEEKRSDAARHRSDVLRGIKDMKVSDMRKEKMIKGSNIAANVLLGVGSTVLGFAGGVNAANYLIGIGSDTAGLVMFGTESLAGAGAGVYANASAGSVGRGSVRKYRERKYSS